ncbi:AsmA-like C-terminal region-containing protein [Chitinispirillales bacterium ANBcel5]|uniref:AsmA-like C-terminal region-containing protein n=1 Tax=Cellulosispirillum alkaliphilum TaxID=3039283 RepID=UPI002A513DB4|nr:AsmA-like C-terminal region-containing protein [Chitinispirillales bacterium ANBcel5]
MAREIIHSYGADSALFGNVSVSLWSGIRIRDSFLSKKISQDSSYWVQIDDLRFRMNLLFAAVGGVAGRITPHEQRADYFYKILNSPFETTAEGIEKLSTTTGLRRIDVSGLSFRVLCEKGTDVYLRGGDVRLRKSWGRTLKGALRLEEVRLNDKKVVRDLRSSLLLRESGIRVRSARGELLNGRLRLGGAIDLKKKTLTRANVEIRGSDLQVLSGVIDDKTGELSGKVDVSIRVDESVADIDSLIISGELRARDVQLKEFSFQRSLVSNMVAPVLSRLAFREISSEFEIKSGKVMTETRGYGDQLDFTASGWINPELYIDQQVEATLYQAIVSELPRVAASSLESTDDGNAMVRCRLFGKVYQPAIELERGTVRRAVGAAVDDVGQGIRSIFRTRR